MCHVWGTGESHTILWWRNLRESLGVNGRIIIKCFVKKVDGDLDWIAVAQGMDRLWALVNFLIKL
jgi:hypothetical protein